MSGSPRLWPPVSLLGALARDLADVVREERRHRPHPPANAASAVVVDMYPCDSFERPGGETLDISKPLIVADGHALPFADHSFDYVIASHVIEHATDPRRFAAELSRVAAAGFVQVPSRESELVYGWAFHPWLLGRRGDTLIFEPRGGRRAPVGEAMHADFWASPLLRLAWTSRRSRWHHSIEWRGQLDVEVTGTSEAERTAALDVELTVAELTRAAVPPLPEVVRAAARCPACLQGLKWAPTIVACDGCGRAYPLAGEVPLLLDEAAGAGA